MEILKVKKSHENAKLPEYATVGAACFDLYAATIEEPSGTDFEHNTLTYNTGLQFEVPAGHVLMIFSRSGHGFNQGITLANGTGIIDSDYRGDVKVKLTSQCSHKATFPNVGERIAQAMLLPIPVVRFAEVDELSETERGTGGFGSTGVK